ncbi:MAG: tryptophan synthase subunit alpha [Sedimentisphaerales bacterium]|jgi:tryptophan synthase alpha chain|nr:tryptophan synthase subunit alpha [Sedimentisphaerales bacterium]
MSSYKQVFLSGKVALIPFFVLGDPDEQTCLEIIGAAIDAGADILELGIPFSDPIADGPTIQKADIRALRAGMTPQKALTLISRIEERWDIPIGLLVYYNLVWHFGPEAFYKQAAKAGVNSVLIADLSIDDADEVYPLARSAGLDTVFMVSPNSSDERIRLVAQKTTGFIYAVSVLGVTGARDTLSQSAIDIITRTKRVTTVPVCLGFGISRPEHAAAAAAVGADGVIVGSKLVGLVEQNLSDKGQIVRSVRQLILQFRSAL